MLFTLNDDGYLRFVKLFDVFEPEQGEVLLEKKVRIQSGRTYELGIINKKDTFVLFMDGEKVGEIEDSQLYGDVNGIYASGQGTHLFEQIIIRKAP